MSEDITNYIENYTPLTPEQIAERQAYHTKIQQQSRLIEQFIQDQRKKTNGTCETDLGSGTFAHNVAYQHGPCVTSVVIDNTDDFAEDAGIELSPRQALTLLAWLETQKGVLEQLAKEQGE